MKQSRKMPRWAKILRNGIYLVLGDAIVAFAVQYFYLPNDLLTGGATGLALILHKLFSVDTALTVFLINLLLMAAATGGSLSYDMLYEETNILKDTEYDVLYYANYANWTDTAAEEYRQLAPLLSKVSDCTITGYETDDSGDRITTTYSDGTVVKVDLEARTVEYDGNTVSFANEDEEGGITS